MPDVKRENRDGAFMPKTTCLLLVLALLCLCLGSCASTPLGDFSIIGGQKAIAVQESIYFAHSGHLVNAHNEDGIYALTRGESTAQLLLEGVSPDRLYYRAGNLYFVQDSLYSYHIETQQLRPLLIGSYDDFLVTPEGYYLLAQQQLFYYNNSDILFIDECDYILGAFGGGIYYVLGGDVYHHNIIQQTIFVYSGFGLRMTLQDNMLYLDNERDIYAYDLLSGARRTVHASAGYIYSYVPYKNSLYVVQSSLTTTDNVLLEVTMDSSATTTICTYYGLQKAYRFGQGLVTTSLSGGNYAWQTLIDDQLVDIALEAPASTQQ